MTPEELEQLLQDGIAAVQDGDKAHARTLLLQVVEQDDHIEQAWYWLSLAVEDVDDKLLALENVLALNPEHDIARGNLEWWQQRVKYEQESRASRPRRAPAAPAPAPVGSPPTEPTPALAEAPVVVPAALSSDSTGAEPHTTEVRDAPFTDFAATKVERTHATQFGDDGAYDPYQCIYCGYLATPEDRRCPDCRRKLMARRPRNRRTSGALKSARLVTSLLTFLATIELLVTISVAGFGERSLQLALGFASTLLGFELFFGDLGALETQTFVILIGAHALRLVLFGVVTFGLFARLNLSFYLAIVVLVVEILLAGYRFAVGYSGPGALALSAALALAGLYLMFSSDGDFDVAEERVRCEPDKEAKGAAELSRRGYQYSREGKWGLAVAHFQGAVAAMPDRMQLYKQLALGYAQLGRYERARSALWEIERRNPQDAEVQELVAMVKDQQANDAARGGEWWRLA